VSAIWQQTDSGGWKLLEPVGFPDERALHGLVERSPQILPLSGKPQLVVLGREVGLGGNKADLIAIETTGRPVVMEVKLAHNAESRRAVAAQVLTYAAFLHKLSVAQLETEILGRHLHDLGVTTVAEAVKNVDQEGIFDEDEFLRSLSAHLSAGSFRLVLILDAAPLELIRLIGYVTSVTDKLVVDLITVSEFEVGGTKILVPQRVDPERLEIEPTPSRGGDERGVLTDGAGEFVPAIGDAPAAIQPTLRKLADWAIGLEKRHMVRLASFRGKRGEVILLPRLQPENAGLATVWNDGRKARLQVWRSVFERRAPKSIEPMEHALGSTALGQGTWTDRVSDLLLQTLTQAYEEATKTQSV
jgi:hypothetical protein